MQRNQIFLIIVPNSNPYTDCRLQIRTNLEPLQSYKFDRVIDGNDIVIKVPEPIIEIAIGRRDDLFGLANKLFGARWGAWTYVEECWTYQIQGDGLVDLPPPLTERERSIMAHLAIEAKTSNEICNAFPSDLPANIRSSLRYLYENGFLVIDGSSIEAKYHIRK